MKAEHSPTALFANLHTEMEIPPFNMEHRRPHFPKRGRSREHIDPRDRANMIRLPGPGTESRVEIIWRKHGNEMLAPKRERDGP